MIFDINKDATPILNSIAESYADLYILLNKNDFSPEIYSDIKNHPFVDFLKTMDENFDITSDGLVFLHEENFMPSWNKTLIENEISKILDTHLFTEYKNIEKVHSYKDLFTTRPDQLILLLSSKNTKDNEEIIHFLYSISENFFSASPILLIDVISSLIKNSNETTSNTNLDAITQLGKHALNQIKNTLNNKKINHLDYKIEKIISRWEFFMRLPTEGNHKDYFKNTINAIFNPENVLDNKMLFLELLKGLVLLI
jgi:hypothetical protein